MGDFNRPKRSLYDHKAPVLPPRELRRLSRLSFVLMHDKKGWQCLPNPGFSTNTSDYLRVPPTTTHDDVDVDKGTLVEVDPQSDFDPSNNISVIVVSVDRPEIKISLLMKVSLVQFQFVLKLLTVMLISKGFFHCDLQKTFFKKSWPWIG